MVGTRLAGYCATASCLVLRLRRPTHCSTRPGKTSIRIAFGPSSWGMKSPEGTASAPSPSVCWRSEEHTSELQSRLHLVCRLLLEKKKKRKENELTRSEH